jgi:hypothetical protein
MESTDLRQHPEEIDTHFKMRLDVYNRVIAAGESAERALLLSNIFRNCYFMGCGYDKSLVADSQKYWDKDWVAHYVQFTQS